MSSPADRPVITFLGRCASWRSSRRFALVSPPYETSHPGRVVEGYTRCAPWLKRGGPCHQGPAAPAAWRPAAPTTAGSSEPACRSGPARDLAPAHRRPGTRPRRLRADPEHRARYRRRRRGRRRLRRCRASPRAAPGRDVDHRREKSHVACVGADSFTTPGADEYQVFDTAIGRIGLQICYDWRFPEVTRVLALKGSERSRPVPADLHSPVRSVPAVLVHQSSLRFCLQTKLGEPRLYNWAVSSNS